MDEGFLPNDAQRQAIETIEGPVLVIAGPGTGKTSLLTKRVEHILKTTDTPPETIMCLTFTENAAQEMRQRLRTQIGSEAEKIHISTYHALGNTLMSTYRDYFDQPQTNAIDELMQDQLIRQCILQAPAGPIRLHADAYTHDIRSLIAELKRAGLQPDDVRGSIIANIDDIKNASELTKEIEPFRAVSKKVVPVFEKLHDGLSSLKLGELGSRLTMDLEQAINAVHDTGKTTPLTEWKNAWLDKDSANRFVIQGSRHHAKLLVFCRIYEQYQAELEKSGQYDYDDMIIQVSKLLRNNNELRYSLQEKYLYYMLDEFQDTNASQFELIKTLTDNPVHEGRPNILAVGDDDQAIYAFQGADHTNMRQFLDTYREPVIITLLDNYRSGQGIIAQHARVAEQILERLAGPKIPPKMIRPAVPDKKAVVSRYSFRANMEEAAWIAQDIATRHAAGMPLAQIAILAPKHRYLAELTSHLHARSIPVMYEKRENILDSELVIVLESVAKLVVMLHEDPAYADSLLAEVLSHELWGVPPEHLWKLSLQARRDKKLFSETCLDDRLAQTFMQWFIDLGNKCAHTPLEQMLDEIIGTESGISPLYRHYFSDIHAPTFVHLLNNLQLLRHRVASYVHDEERTLRLKDFVALLEQYRASGVTLTNTNPCYDADDAVHVMTVYKAKGREFDTVYVPYLVDEVWGKKSKDKSTTLNLPANLAHVTYVGKSDDERCRILYVALSRARLELILTTHQATSEGTARSPLAFIDMTDATLVENETSTSPEVLLPHWHDRHASRFNDSSSAKLLEDELARYRISASHVNQFTDLMYSGPKYFLVHSLLRFPSDVGAEAHYGNSVHETLEWAHRQILQHGQLPSKSTVQQYLVKSLTSKPFSDDQRSHFIERGTYSLYESLRHQTDLMTSEHRSEVNFRAENVLFDNIRLTGSIDRLGVDGKNKLVTIYDFKTGRAFASWEKSDAKLHSYRKQLMFYKLLVENSLSFRNYKVEKGVIVFAEPDESGEYHRLAIDFTEAGEELERYKQLLQTVWNHIHRLDFPEIDTFPNTMKGILAFEDWLIERA